MSNEIVTFGTRDFEDSLALMATAIKGLCGESRLKTLRVDVSPDNIATVSVIQTSRVTLQLNRY